MDEQITQEGFATLDDYKTTPVQEPLFELESLAVSTSVSLEDIKKQLKTTKEMLDERYIANEVYKNNHEILATAQKTLKQTKAQIEQVADVAALLNKTKELKDQLKEKKAAISDYALEVMRATGNTEFEKDGHTYDIVPVAKLVRRHQ